MSKDQCLMCKQVTPPDYAKEAGVEPDPIFVTVTPRMLGELTSGAVVTVKTERGPVVLSWGGV